MLINMKTNIVSITIFIMLVTATISTPFFKIFGKNYNNTKDFSCCVGDRLVIHHYYTLNILWIEVADGYTNEVIGHSDARGCVIRCVE